MSSELLVRHCAPTLAGLKTGNLFSCSYNNISDFIKTIEDFNTLLNSKGVFFALLRCSGGRALVYVYRKKRIEKLLHNGDVQKFLSLYGYNDFSVGACLELLGEHLKLKDFPHEIGVFLSYPLPDILAFIENKGQNYITVGCWKVYGNVDEARKTFARYKKCTEVYQKKLEQSFDITRLTVAG